MQIIAKAAGSMLGNTLKGNKRLNLVSILEEENAERRVVRISNGEQKAFHVP